VRTVGSNASYRVKASRVKQWLSACEWAWILAISRRWNLSHRSSICEYSGFLIFTQLVTSPETYVPFAHFATIPSRENPRDA
jgi:hypothetical protein